MSVEFLLESFDRKSSIIVAADDSTISWGPSPTFGELVGYLISERISFRPVFVSTSGKQIFSQVWGTTVLEDLGVAAGSHGGFPGQSHTEHYMTLNIG